MGFVFHGKVPGRKPVPIWDRIQKGDGCWLWTGCRDKDGYGRVQIKGKPLRAYRVVFEMAYGYKPPLVMHKCDNPSCVRPDHLAAGTLELNAFDRHAKGRSARRGANHRWNKISPEAVVRIKELHAQGVTPAALAREYSVNHKSIVRALQWA